jgi:hypothetical protein
MSRTTAVTRIAAAVFGIAAKQETLPTFAEVAGLAMEQYQAEFGAFANPVRKQTVNVGFRQVIERLSRENNITFQKDTKITGRPKKVESFKAGLKKEFTNLA